MASIFKTLTVLAGALTLMHGAAAQDFPADNRPIKIVVPYTAGGSSDFLARLVAKKMGENMNHNIIVENKPGGSTVLGGDYVARSAPDGYTVYLIGELTNASLVATRKDLPYDPVKSFAGITNLVASPLVISVHPGFPAKTLKEFVDYAKAHPSKVTYGSAGLGNTLHLGGAQFASQTGIDMTHVPYKGASQAIIDLVAGRIDVMFDLPQTPLPQIQEGKLRPLAVTSKERLDLMPDVPTTAEAGYGDFTFATRIGLAVPANTPDSVRETLRKAAIEAVNAPEVKQALADRAMYVATSETPQEFDKNLADAVATVGKLLRDAGVEPQ